MYIRFRTWCYLSKHHVLLVHNWCYKTLRTPATVPVAQFCGSASEGDKVLLCISMYYHVFVLYVGMYTCMYVCMCMCVYMHTSTMNVCLRGKCYLLL